LEGAAMIAIGIVAIGFSIGSLDFIGQVGYALVGGGFVWIVSKLYGRVHFRLHPGEGRDHCPLCGARPYEPCREYLNGVGWGPMDYRHYERYERERAPR